MRQSLARLLLRFFEAHDRERDLLRWVVSEEVTKAANPDTIFRSPFFMLGFLFQFQIALTTCSLCREESLSMKLLSLNAFTGRGTIPQSFLYLFLF